MNLEDLLQKPEQIKLPDYIISDSEMVGYPDLQMQQTIYEWALEGLSLTGKTLLDVGAGRGDIFSYCNNEVNYIGFEINPVLIQAGQEKYKLETNFNLLQSDYLTTELSQQVDIGVCIGTLNDINTSEKWKTFKTFFDKMYKECSERIIVICNNTSEEGLNYFPLDELFKFCLSDTITPFKLDYQKFEGIYKLTVFK